MDRNRSRFSSIIRWHCLRWGLAISAMPLALWACDSHKLVEPLPNPQQETDFQVLVSPVRAVDILFMIDNSPSMDPKQNRLATNFPLMMQILQNLPDPTTGGVSLPDVHIGVVDSDVGAGNGSLGQTARGFWATGAFCGGTTPTIPSPRSRPRKARSTTPLTLQLRPQPTGAAWPRARAGFQMSRIPRAGGHRITLGILRTSSLASLWPREPAVAEKSTNCRRFV